VNQKCVQKFTFIDPKTGEELESTWMSRFLPLLISGLSFGLVYLVIGVLIAQDLGWIWLAFGLLSWLAFGLLSAIGLMRVYRRGRNTYLDRLHDTIARKQHKHRNRKAEGQKVKSFKSQTPGVRS